MSMQLGILGIVILTLIASRLLRSLYYIQLGYKQAARTKPYVRTLADPQFKILFVGDSTGVGTGASSPEYSIAGLIAQKYPTASVINSAAGPTVRYVDLFVEKAVDPFIQDPQQYFSEDQFHPSDAGYAQWMTKITVELDHFDLR